MYTVYIAKQLCSMLDKLVTFKAVFIIRAKGTPPFKNRNAQEPRPPRRLRRIGLGLRAHRVRAAAAYSCARQLHCAGHKSGAQCCPGTTPRAYVSGEKTETGRLRGCAWAWASRYAGLTRQAQTGVTSLSMNAGTGKLKVVSAVRAGVPKAKLSAAEAKSLANYDASAALGLQKEVCISIIDRVD